MTTIKQKIEANADQLRTMDQPTLTAWAKVNGIDSRAGFAAFKKALLTIGVDYNALRAQRFAAKQEAMTAAASASLTLYTDAKARTDRFAICDRKGEPVWFGKFFDNDRDYDGEQSSGEMAAAKKAVWLASKVKETIGASAISLTLKVDAEWLCWANEVATGGKAGGKARPLGEMAQRYGIVLTVEHVPGVDNPADRYTVTTGFQKWQDTDLRGLIDASPEGAGEPL